MSVIGVHPAAKYEDVPDLGQERRGRRQPNTPSASFCPGLRSRRGPFKAVGNHTKSSLPMLRQGACKRLVPRLCVEVITRLRMRRSR